MFTPDDLTVVEAAIASGTLRVKFSDREVQYQTTSDLLRAREAIRKALGKSSIRPIVTTYNKGLDRVDALVEGVVPSYPWSRR